MSKLQQYDVAVRLQVMAKGSEEAKQIGEHIVSSGTSVFERQQANNDTPRDPLVGWGVVNVGRAI